MKLRIYMKSGNAIVGLRLERKSYFGYLPHNTRLLIKTIDLSQIEAITVS